jgi:hypothetical protein
MIRYACPKCGRQLRAGDDLTGRQVFCPSCHHQMAVPDPAAEFLRSVTAAAADSEAVVAEEDWPVSRASDDPFPEITAARQRITLRGRLQANARVMIGVLVGAVLGGLPGLAWCYAQSTVAGEQAAPPGAEGWQGAWLLLLAAGANVGIFLGALVGSYLSGPGSGPVWRAGAGGGALAGGCLGTGGAILTLVITLFIMFLLAVCGGATAVNTVFMTGLLIAAAILVGAVISGTVLGGLGAALGTLLARHLAEEPPQRGGA